jgi:2-dehydropantoate 2-reductase
VDAAREVQAGQVHGVFDRDTLEALQAVGLTVHSKLVGDFSVRPGVTSDPATLEPPDLVLFCVKTYDLDAAAERIRPLRP